MIYLLSAVVVLGLLIFVHEFGHFIFAKLFGVGVEKFSLGFGPKIGGKTIGETEYLISAFPLGGYVKMIGESPDAEISPEKNRHCCRWARIQPAFCGTSLHYRLYGRGAHSDNKDR